jgi:hypothetical protein
VLSGFPSVGKTGGVLYARVDSNHWPLVPETNALSGLSYGRVSILVTHFAGGLQWRWARTNPDGSRLAHSVS